MIPVERAVAMDIDRVCLFYVPIYNLISVFGFEENLQIYPHMYVVKSGLLSVLSSNSIRILLTCHDDKIKLKDVIYGQRFLMLCKTNQGIPNKPESLRANASDAVTVVGGMADDFVGKASPKLHHCTRSVQSTFFWSSVV